jgi:hypothetical protein
MELTTFPTALTVEKVAFAVPTWPPFSSFFADNILAWKCQVLPHLCWAHRGASQSKRVARGVMGKMFVLSGISGLFFTENAR